MENKQEPAFAKAMARRSKILIISLAYHPFVGGAEVAIEEITKRLGSDFEFQMITANLDGIQKSEEENFNGIDKVYRVGKNKLSKYLFPWLAYRKAIKLQQENNYSVVWTMMANQAGWAALKFKKKFTRTKYLLTLQEGDSEWDIWVRTFLIRLVYKNIYKQADYIQVISNFLKKRAENLGAKCSIEVVPNGVESQKHKNTENLSIGRQAQKQDIKRIITVSRLVKKNGVEYLIKAFSILNKSSKSQVLSCKLIIIGSGKLRLELENLVNKLSLKNKVEFLGQVSNDQVYEKLAQADIFVRSSLSEGLGNAFLEAMAVGIPVIATPVGGIPDFLKDGETGWFCKVKDPKSIAEKINYILNPDNKDEVDRVVENAEKMVEEKYNWDHISIKMKNIFIKLINN